jgi:fructose-1,6-bisphosphatase/inositol monophosphatase family enzyme
MSELPLPPEVFIARLSAFQRRLRDHLLDLLRGQGAAMSDVARDDDADGDVIYFIDEKAEELLFEECEAWGRETPFVLVAEGIPGNGWRPFPENTDPADAAFFLVVDPIDGTREIMYDRRSAWALAGIAPNRGPGTNLRDIEIAVQTELSTTHHLYSDTLWAGRGRGARAERQNLVTGEITAFIPRPTRVPTIAHGFASISKFFPGSKAAVAEMEERLYVEIFGTVDGESPLAFEDQYVSSGGQLYELMVGHDRFNADLRPLFVPDEITRLACHPYDLCTELIAREAGVIVTDARGEKLSAPLDIRAAVSWIGYANAGIENQVAPILLRLLSERLPVTPA